MIIKKYLTDRSEYKDSAIDSFMQKSRISNMRRDESKLFLIDYKLDKKGRHCFKVCNSDNSANPLNVVVEKNHKEEESKDTIRCTCKDYKFRCYKNNIICKHCVFIIENGCKLSTDKIVKGRKITDLSKFEEKLKDIKVVKFTNKANDLFTDKSKEIEEDDVCPVCLNDLNDEELVSCPKCKNYVHTDCIKVWMTTHSNCIYCRSDVWKNFKVAPVAV